MPTPWMRLDSPACSSVPVPLTVVPPLVAAVVWRFWRASQFSIRHWAKPVGAVLLALSDKNDLGVHTQYLAADTLRLFARGVITNRRKGYHDGKIVASSAIGTESSSFR